MTTTDLALIADLPLGESSRTTGRTISEGEFMLLHNLMGAMTPLHANKHYMQSTEYGERILGGGMLIGLLAAGWAGSDLYRRLVSDYGVRWTAALGVDGNFLNPFFPGDTLYIVHSVNDIRVSKTRAGQAIMSVGMSGENQDGVICCAGNLRAMFDRPGLSASESSHDPS
jgi:acyl dehydratase